MRPLVFFPIICLLLLRSQTAHSQLEVTVTIENQEVVGSDLFFDLHLRRSSSSGNGDLYLANADFVLNFDAEYFTSPTLTQVGNSPGWCNFEPTDKSGNNTLFTQSFYFDNSITSIRNGNYLVINLNGPAPSETTFDTRVARINSTSYRLGRFKLSGISTNQGSSALTWGSNGNLTTKIFTFENTPPYISSDVGNLNLINPAGVVLPVELIDFSGKIWNDSQVRLEWTTATEFSNHGFAVERIDGAHEWQQLGFVRGQGHSEVEHRYNFIDSFPLTGSNLYRLIQFDIDGSESQSSIISVSYNPANMEALFYPNPVGNFLYFREPNGTFYRIFNSMGQLELEGRLRQNGIVTSTLPQGIYILQLKGNIYKIYKR